MSSGSRSPSISSYGGGLKPDKPTPKPEDLDVQSVINERRPSRLKPMAAPSFASYGQQQAQPPAITLQLKEESSAAEDCQYVSVGCGPSNGSSSVELRIFVDETEAAPGDGQQQETRADAEVVVVEAGKRRHKSPGRDEPKA